MNLRPRRAAPAPAPALAPNTATAASSAPHVVPRQRPSPLSCFHCWRVLSLDPAYIVCAHGACMSRTICVQCFHVGAADEHPHQPDHPYRIIESVETPLFETDWSADDELRLINALCEYGLDHWKAIAKCVGKSKEQCERHYKRVYLTGKNSPIPTSFLASASSQATNSSTHGILNTTLEPSIPAPDQAPPTSRSIPNLPSAKPPGQGPAIVITVGGRTTKLPRRATLPQRSDDDDSDLDIGGNVIPDTTYGNDTNIEGCMPRRGDLDIEYDDDAEEIIADMTIDEDDNEEERELKLQLLQMYDKRLARRDQMKQFILRHDLIHVDKLKIADDGQTNDEKELLARIQVFSRLLSDKDFHEFKHATMREYRLSREIHRLRQYRNAGVKRRAEIENYDFDCEARAARLDKEDRLIKKRRKVRFASNPNTVEPHAHTAEAPHRETENEIVDELEVSISQDAKQNIQETNSKSAQFGINAKSAFENIKMSTAETDNISHHSTERVQGGLHIADNEVQNDSNGRNAATSSFVHHERQHHQNPAGPDQQLRPMPIDELADVWKLTPMEQKISSALHITPTDFLQQRDAMLSQARRQLRANQNASVNDGEGILTPRCVNFPRTVFQKSTAPEEKTSEKKVATDVAPGEVTRSEHFRTDTPGVAKATVASQRRSCTTGQGGFFHVGEPVRSGMTEVQTEDGGVANANSGRSRDRNVAQLHEALVKVRMTATERSGIQKTAQPGDDPPSRVERGNGGSAVSRKRPRAQENGADESVAKPKRQRRRIVLSEEEDEVAEVMPEDHSKETASEVNASEFEKHATQEQEAPNRGKGRPHGGDSNRGRGTVRRRKVIEESDSINSEVEKVVCDTEVEKAVCDTEVRIGGWDHAQKRKGETVVTAKRGKPKMVLRSHPKTPASDAYRRQTRAQARAALTSASEREEERGRGRRTGAASRATQRLIKRSECGHVASVTGKRKNNELGQSSNERGVGKNRGDDEVVVEERKPRPLVKKGSRTDKARDDASSNGEVEGVLEEKQNPTESERKRDGASHSKGDADEIVLDVVPDQTDVRTQPVARRTRRIPRRRIVEEDDEDDSDEEEIVIRRSSRRKRKERSEESHMVGDEDRSKKSKRTRFDENIVRVERSRGGSNRESVHVTAGRGSRHEVKKITPSIGSERSRRGGPSDTRRRGRSAGVPEERYWLRRRA